MNIEEQVKKIINDIKLYGDLAIIKYTKKFDRINIELNQLKINEKTKLLYFKKLNKNTKNIIDSAYRNIFSFHKNELKYIKNYWEYKNKDIKLGQKLTSIELVGVYVPGGLFSYFSTVLMSCIPAKIAGVKKIILATSLRNITPELIYASRICGVNDIYCVGGPMAIAAFAFGTKTIPKVDIIVGPGNIYVTEAKRQVFGYVGIDMLAGPTEIAVICDKTAKPLFVAYDLMSQLEHDKNSKGFVFSENVSVLNQIKKNISKNFIGQIVFKKLNLEKSIQHINKIAPEHLEIIHKNADYIFKKIKHSGTIFIGNYTPVVVGDYYAGPSHILPTSSTAKFYSGISVMTFLKRINFIKYNKNSFLKDAGNIIKLAELEGLKLHVGAIKIRT